MASVFQVRQRETGAARALKLLPVGADPELVQRFQVEVEALSRVDGHPHVMRVFSCGVHAGRPYLVLELVEGTDLAASLAAGGPWPPARAARLVAQLARGLAHVHARGVLHRDLKPANVLLTPEGTPKLVDFGLARLTGAESLTRTGSVLGSPAWMAPEQVEGLGAVDARTDVYGLGAILYALLCGRAPFGGDGAPLMRVLQQVLTERPLPPSRLTPGLPPALEALCLRCLSRAPGERPPSAQAVAEELDRCALAGDARADGPGWLRWSAGAAVASALLCATALVFFRPDRPEQEPVPPLRPPRGQVVELPAPLRALVQEALAGVLEHSPGETRDRLQEVARSGLPPRVWRAEAQRLWDAGAVRWSQRLEAELGRGAGLNLLDAAGPLVDAGLSLPEPLRVVTEQAIARERAANPTEARAIVHLAGVYLRRDYLLRVRPDPSVVAWVKDALPLFINAPCPSDLGYLALTCDLFGMPPLFTTLDLMRRAESAPGEAHEARALRPESRALALAECGLLARRIKVDEVSSPDQLAQLLPLVGLGHAAVHGAVEDLGPRGMLEARLVWGRLLQGVVRIAGQAPRWPPAAVWPFQEQLRACGRQVRTSDPLPESYRLTDACHWESNAWDFLGHPERSLEVWRECLARLRARPEVDPFLVLVGACNCMRTHGRLEEGQRLGREALQLAGDDDLRQVRARTALVALLLDLGELAEAERLVDPARGRPEQWARMDPWFAEQWYHVAERRRDLLAMRARLEALHRLKLAEDAYPARLRRLEQLERAARPR